MMKSNAQKMYRNLYLALIFTFIVALIVFGVSWAYIIKMSRNQAKLNTEAKGFMEENMVLSDLKLDLARLGTNKDVVYQIIPQSKDVSEFLSAFENTAKSDTLAVTGVSVGDLQKKTKSGSEFSQTVSKDQYYELPIKYEVSGDYMNLTKLLSDISNGRRLASVTNLLVSAENSDKGVIGKIKASFIVTVYIKK